MPGGMATPETVQLPVSIEVLKTTVAGMIEEGVELAKIASNVIVKLPCTIEGVQACKALTANGIGTNMTLCFNAPQALLVAKAGATYVSPFVGRLEDAGRPSMELVANMKIIYQNFRLRTKILVASIRNVNHIIDAARIGADVVTVPFSVISTLMDDPLTTKGLQIFLDDARSADSKA